MLIVNKKFIEQALTTYKASKAVREVFLKLTGGTKCSDCVLKEHSGVPPSTCAHGKSLQFFELLSR
jgi:hypothetical protein